ncbi:hypothetical protein N802_12410 [Knoellia sinensis KCTC 19936]|uniref:Serine protease n=1 Tax=Knoellia sinensis KCTC 19936 TaxID=1385520 RepID=A0A0A0JC68_9MICO|nr:hypothetical protein [Knoellia sinensis]KGN34394.1 hypothetical protein N802_12410 [Knoellia sinensis KCTC 19936]
MSEPIAYQDLASKVGQREAQAEMPDTAIRETLFLTGREPIPEIADVSEVQPTHKGPEGVRTFRVDLDVPRTAIGVHTFPPGVEGTKLSARRTLLVEEEYPQHVEGFLPDHLALKVQPGKLDRQLRRRLKRTKVDADDPEVKWATTIFPPEDRYAFNDTSFPWCTTGRVETSNGGWASGSMVGPRHLLTCSHAIGWITNPDPYVAGWINFTPSYFDGSAPFGKAWGTHIYWQEQVFGPFIEGTEERHDYVVVVLDRRIGDLTGWMGSKSYTDTWDGGTYWSHIGYPEDVAGGTRPIFVGDFALDGHDTQNDSAQALLHTADVIPGQSGGPMFGWWEGEPWPRVVADQSWQNESSNGASGGSKMVDLIIRARNEHP